MLEIKKFGILLAAVLLVSGCATYLPSGSFVVDGTMGGSSRPNLTPGSKKGEACMTSVLALIASGDASVEAAMKNGGIHKVATLDYRVSNILGIYGEYCTVITGE